MKDRAQDRSQRRACTGRLLHHLLLRQGAGKPAAAPTATGSAPTPARTIHRGAGWRTRPQKEGKKVLTITIQVNAPSGQAIGIKEDIAAYLEKFGDASVVSIVEKLPEQLRMDGPPQRGAGPAERTRQAVYATGNKWAIENFEATHG